MNPRKRLIRKLKWEQELVDRKVFKIETLPINLIAEAYPQGIWDPYCWDGPEFLLPLDFSLIQSVKDFMALQFPEASFRREYQIIWEMRASAARFLKYEFPPSCELEFRFESSREGSNCKLHQIGVEQVAKPIYEVTCGEVNE